MKIVDAWKIFGGCGGGAGTFAGIAGAGIARARDGGKARDSVWRATAFKVRALRLLLRRIRLCAP